MNLNIDVPLKFHIHTNYFQDNLGKFMCLNCNEEVILSLYKASISNPVCPYCSGELDLMVYCDDNEQIEELGCLGIYHHEDLKVYISGKITGNPNYKEEFAKAEKWLKSIGCIVMNPSVLSEGFTHDEYMQICYSMIDVCNAMYFLKNWEQSVGAKMENEYAEQSNKIKLFE